MVDDFTVSPNPRAAESKRVETVPSGRLVYSVPFVRLHPGWGFQGDCLGFEATYERFENGQIEQRTVDGLVPDLMPDGEYGFSAGSIPIEFADYDYVDAYGDRQYGRLTSLSLIVSYEGTGRVLVHDGRVVIHEGKVVIDR